MKKFFIVLLSVVVFLASIFWIVPFVYGFSIQNSYELNIVSNETNLEINKDEFISIFQFIEVKNGRNLIDTQHDFNGIGLYHLKDECYEVQNRGVSGGKYAFVDDNGECFVFIDIPTSDLYWPGGSEVVELYVNNTFVFPSYKTDKIKSLIIHNTANDPKSLYLGRVQISDKDIVISDANAIKIILLAENYDDLSRKLNFNSNDQYIVLAEFENNPIYETLAVLT